MLFGPVKCTDISEDPAASVVSVSHHLVYLSNVKFSAMMMEAV